jgi:hypothetical protein
MGTIFILLLLRDVLPALWDCRLTLQALPFTQFSPTTAPAQSSSALHGEPDEMPQAPLQTGKQLR